MRNLIKLIGQLFSKSCDPSVVRGRIIDGRVLELYPELTDSPTNTLEEACVLSAIFALRYLSREIAANVESVDVRFRRYSTRSLADGPIFQYWKFGDAQKRWINPHDKVPTSSTHDSRSRTRSATHTYPYYDI